MSEQMDALKLLQEDCKDDDHETVIAALNRMPTIALAVGATRARTELIAFTTEFCEKDNDEALSCVAKQLGELTELVGGQAHVPVLLPLLEKLSGEEESVVREHACESFNKVIVKMSKQDVAAKVVPLIKRLANGDWFTTRVSACALFASTYPQVPEQVQAELRQLFTTLCNDDTPMVRKSAFVNLGKFSSSVQKQYLKTDIFPILKTLAQDDLDSMRIFTSDCCSSLASKVDPTDFVSVFIPLIEALQDDTSWRVRQQLAKDMHRLCEGQQEQVSAKKLLPLFVKLLKDKEAEVRSVACMELGRVGNYVKSGLLEHVAPILDALAVDPVVNVRVAFAQAICLLCPQFGKETAQKLLVPIIQQMCKDEHHEVRNYIIGNITDISDALGQAGIDKGILPALLDLSKDPKWRVRMAVVDKAALMAKHIGVKNFERKLQQVLITSLSDHVYAIREKACEQIGQLVKLFGGKWAAEKFLASCFSIYDKTTNYLHRMTCLLVVRHVAPHCGSEVCEKNLLALVLNAAVDDVPNVRIAGSKALGDLALYLDKNLVASKVKPVLQKLVKDQDPDVQFFSGIALKNCP
jgi:serine/threonine-protein phosphatase 2A regulatory subunit A